jgi:hypothetical protein
MKTQEDGVSVEAMMLDERASRLDAKEKKEFYLIFLSP